MKNIGLLRLFSLSANIKLVNVCAGFISTIILVKLLNTTQFGVYAFFLSVLSILIIPSTMGIPEVVLREVAKNSNIKQKNKLKLVLLWARNATFFCSILSMFIFIIFYNFYDFSKLALDKNIFLLLCLIICIPLSSINAVRSSALLGLNEPIIGQIIENLVRPLSLLVLLLITLLLIDGTIKAEVGLYIYACSLIISFFTGLYFLIKKTPNFGSEKIEVTFKDTLFLTKSALPLAFISGLYIVSQQIDLILLGFISTVENLAIYKIAIQLSVLIIFGQQVLRAVVAPKFSKLWDEGKIIDLQRISIISSRVSLFSAIVIFYVFYLFGEYILKYFFGEHYLSAYIPMLIICGAQIINAATGSTGLLLNMCGKEKQSIFGLIIGCVVNLLVSIILIPIYGVVGAAIGTASGIIVCNILLWIAVRKNLKIRPSAFAV